MFSLLTRPPLLLLLVLTIVKSQKFIHAGCRVEDGKLIQKETKANNLDMLISPRKGRHIEIEVHQESKDEAEVLLFRVTQYKWVEISLNLIGELYIIFRGIGIEFPPEEERQSLMKVLPNEVKVRNAEDVITNCPQGLLYKKLSPGNSVSFPFVGDENRDEVYLIYPLVNATLYLGPGDNPLYCDELCWDEENNALAMQNKDFNCTHHIPKFEYHFLRIHYAEDKVHILNKANDTLQELKRRPGDRITFFPEGLEGIVYIIQCLQEDCQAPPSGNALGILNQGNSTVDTGIIFLKSKPDTDRTSSEQICHGKLSITGNEKEHLIFLAVILLLVAILISVCVWYIRQ